MNSSATPKWRPVIDATIATMNNTDLFERTLNAQNADDYDGCFTPRGEYERDAYRAELTRRLKEAGFIS